MGYERMRYDPVNRCIYCGRTPPDVALTDEHIIAQGLRGNLILPAASCTDCAEVTGRFEQFYMRETQDALRTNFGIFGKRRKKERRTTIPLKIEDHEGSRIVHTQPGDYPFLLVNALPSRAELISGVTAKRTFDSKISLFVANRQALDNMSGKKIAAPGNHNSIPFVRMLAKIAHAFAVAEYGPNSFKPFLTDIIRKDDQQAWEDIWRRYIGTVDEEGEAFSPNLHEIRLEPCVINGRFLLVCTIRLFAFLKGCSPVYEVVVAEHWNASFPIRTAKIPRTEPV